MKNDKKIHLNNEKKAIGCINKVNEMAITSLPPSNFLIRVSTVVLMRRNELVYKLELKIKNHRSMIQINLELEMLTQF